MKKKNKITLRTKIYLTIVGLFALTGIIYAANPFVFSTFPSLTGVAATKTELFATGYFGGNEDIYTLDCMGIPTLYQIAPPGEKYIAVAPAQSACLNLSRSRKIPLATSAGYSKPENILSESGRRR